MIVRIRLGTGRPLNREGGSNRHLAKTAAAFGIPTALMAGTLAAWRLATDIQLTKTFAIETGLWSHWQIWMALATGLLLISLRLEKYSQSGSKFRR